MAKTTEREREQKKNKSADWKKTKFMFYHIKRSCFCVLLDWIWRFSWHFTTLFFRKKIQHFENNFRSSLDIFFFSVLCLVLNDWHEMILDYELFFILLNDFVKRHYRRNYGMRVVCVFVCVFLLYNIFIAVLRCACVLYVIFFLFDSILWHGRMFTDLYEFPMCTTCVNRTHTLNDSLISSNDSIIFLV